MVEVIHISPYNKRYVFFIAIMTITGYDYLSHSVNFLQPYIMRFANQSIQDHYNITMDTYTANWLWSITVSLSSVTYIIGTVFLPWAMDTIGRRDTGLIVCNVILILAVIAEFLCKPLNSFELFVVGHGLMGLSGAFRPALILFVAESVPDYNRGISSMFTTSGTYGVIALGALMAFYQLFGNDQLWYWYPLVTLILIAPQIIWCRYFPPSPKFLYIEKGMKEEAIKSIKWYHGENANFKHIIETYEHEKHLSKHAESASLKEILTTRHFRIPFLLCLLATIAGYMSGNTIKGSYLNILFISFGIPEQYSMIPTFFIYLISTIICVFVATHFIERVGRRPLLLGSIIIDLMGIVSMLMADALRPSQLSSVFGFMGAFLLTVCLVVGLDRIPTLLIAELSPQGSRSVTAATCYIIGTFLSLIQSLIYPPVHDLWNAWIWVPYIIVEIVCFILLWWKLPETTGKSVDEIVEQWVVDKEDMEREPLLQNGNSNLHRNQSCRF